MTKIWSYVFWRDKGCEAPVAPYRGMLAPTGVLVALTIAMGLWAQPVVSLAARAADSLTDPKEYIAVVLPANRSLATLPAPGLVARAARAEEVR